jgi:hypothetical protein
LFSHRIPLERDPFGKTIWNKLSQRDPFGGTTCPQGVPFRRNPTDWENHLIEIDKSFLLTEFSFRHYLINICEDTLTKTVLPIVS